MIDDWTTAAPFVASCSDVPVGGGVGRGFLFFFVAPHMPQVRCARVVNLADDASACVDVSVGVSPRSPRFSVWSQVELLLLVRVVCWS